jgi:cysteine-rich repeat protein
MPSACTPGCGDGTVGGSEECDDGGFIGDDGCDATCRIEPGWTCTGQSSSCASVCGDSRVVGNEQCDDGNTRNGDCCDASCHFESAGSPCLDDGDLCTNDACGTGGVCQHDIAPDPTCLLPTEPAKAQLKIVPTSGTKGRLQFNWTKGPAVPKASFGTPAAGTPLYALCVYDEIGGTPALALGAAASGDGDCSDGACWRESRRGWRLKNVIGAPSGIVALTLQEGLVDGKSKVQVKMKGPYLLTPSLPLASDPSIVVQVRSSDDQCFGAVFSTSMRNDGVMYRAKSD